MKPKLLTKTSDIWGDSNFTTGCEISPDGLCILTSTASDHLLRLYNTPPPIPLTKSTNLGDHGGEKCDTGMHTDAVADAVADALEDGVGVGVGVGIGSDTPWNSILSAKCGDSVRSYSWYPLMNSYQPQTCAFLAASRDQPIHLIDAYNSSIRATYSPYNGLDEMEAPNIVTFTPDGNRIFASGFRTDRTIHTFDTSRPGRDSDILRLGKTRRSKDGQKGIVSALSFPEKGSLFAGSKIFAVGTYSPGSIYIYDDRQPNGGAAGTVLNGGMPVVGHGKSFARKKRRFVDMSQYDDSDNEGDNDDVDIFSAAKVGWYQARARSGITQLMWSRGSQNDYLLYSASRRSDAVLAWDMRMLSGDATHPIRGIAAYSRDSDTNQRLEFDIDDDGKRLFVASQDRSVKVFDTSSGELLNSIDGFRDAVNGISYSNINGRELLAVATGARRFEDNDDNSGTDGEGSAQRYQSTAENKACFTSDPPGSLELYEI